MKTSIKSKHLGAELTKRILNEYKKLEKVQIDVGFPKGKANAYPGKTTKTGKIIKGMPVQTVAYWNNYGTSRIPARDFINFNAAELANVSKKMFNKMVYQITNGNFAAVTTIQNQLGNLAVGIIQDAITNLRNPPNAPSTIRIKGSSNPLIDTGHMRSSVTYVIKSA